MYIYIYKDFPGGSGIKNLPAMQETCVWSGDMGSIPGLERSLKEKNGDPLQYSCLDNPMDRGALQATVHEVVKESDVTWWLNSKQNIYTTL